MRIHLISGPRNISTALMYSFAQRADMSVVDEPFYGYFLEVSGRVHPGGEEVLQVMETNPRIVTQETILASYPTPHVFFKNMAHHLMGEVNLDFTTECSNVFLIRDPKKLIASLALVIDQPEMLDTGLALSSQLFRQMKEQSGKTPVVINSGDLLQNPEKYLAAVCEAIGIPFYKAMLTWPAGPRPEDGIWAKHWYTSVHQSTGFAPQRSEERELKKELLPLYEEALPHFEYLNEYAIRV
jgi:hypothetical protein